MKQKAIQKLYEEDETMSETEALRVLEIMSEPEFQAFFETLPERVKLCCKGRLVDWRHVLPEWYIKKNGGGKP